MFVTPLDMMRLGVQAGSMALQAQLVISMRVLGSFGVWRVTPSENNRMVGEKFDAMSEAMRGAAAAMLLAKSPIVVADAAMKPYSKRTKSNMKRLARRGPGRPT